MSRFIFRLDSLLKVKEQIEESLKNDLGKAVQKLEHERAKLRRLQETMDLYVLQVNVRAKHGINIQELREYSSYIFYIRSEIDIQKDAVNFNEKNVDKYREMLVKAVQEKKMLQKLKERKFELYLKEQLKHEQGIVDEIVSYDYGKEPENADNI